MALLGDLRWTLAKLERPQLGPVALEADLALAAAARPGDPRLEALHRVIRQNAHLLSPTDPPAFLGAILLSRLDGSPELAAARRALARHVPTPRLTGRWPRPDQPHPALRRTLVGHRRTIGGLAAAAGSGLLASAGTDGTVRLWQVPDGPGRRVLRGHTGAVHACALSPDGTLVASAGADGTVRLWPVPPTWDDAPPLATDVAEESDAAGETEAAGADGSSAGLRVLRGPAGAVTDCAFTPDGQRILAVGVDGVLRCWQVRDGAVVFTVAVTDAPLRCCLAAEHGRWIAVAGDDGIVRICDPRTGRPNARLVGHTGTVLSLTAPPDGTWVGSSGADGTFRRWTNDPDPTRTASGDRSPSRGWREVWMIREQAGAIRAAAVGRDGNLLVTTSWEGAVRLWDVRGGAHRVDLTGAIGSRHCVLSPDGSWVAASGRYGTIRLWSTEVDLPRPSATGREHQMRGAAVVRIRPTPTSDLSDDPASTGERGRPGVVTYTDGGNTAVWDLETGEPTGVTLAGHVDMIRGAGAAPNGSWVVVPGSLAALRRVDPATGAVLSTMTATTEIKAFAVAPSGTWIAASCADGTLQRWDAISVRPLSAALPAHVGMAVACAVSPDGRWIATGGEDRLVRLWTTALVCHRTLSGHLDTVLGADFAPDSRLLATAGADHTVRIWRLDDGDPVATLTGHNHTVRDARFSPDGSLLATAGGDGALWIWDAASWRPVTMMRFDGAARSCAWLPADLGHGIIVASSAGLFRYDYEP